MQEGVRINDLINYEFHHIDSKSTYIIISIIYQLLPYSVDKSALVHFTILHIFLHIVFIHNNVANICNMQTLKASVNVVAVHEHE